MKSTPHTPMPPPKELSIAAHSEWIALAKHVALTEPDARAFGLLCEALADEKRLARLVKQQGPTLTTRGGGTKANPAMRGLFAARAQATRLLSDVGLTPKGRRVAKMDLPKSNAESPFGRLRRGMRSVAREGEE